MAGKVLLLTGAPCSSSLNWDPSILLSDFSASIARFAQLPEPAGVEAPTPSAAAQQHAVWRSLTLERACLHSGFTQQQHDLVHWDHNKSDFFTTAGVCFMTDDGSQHSEEVTNDLLTQFYEQSLAVHDQVSSSQLLVESQAGENTTTSFITDTSASFDETSFADGTSKQPLGISRPVTDLKDIPSPAYLLKVQPATVTRNLIVGIISVSAPRAIRTRWGGTSSLVEVLVGDETKSGFAVTFWLSSATLEGTELAGLRAQDVVLLQNVALNVFMKKVYGSSLRKGMTKVYLLHRRKLDRQDVGGYYGTKDLSSTETGNAQLEKSRRVWEWILNFVGTGPVAPGGKAPERPWDRPPEDTQ